MNSGRQKSKRQLEIFFSHFLAQLFDILDVLPREYSNFLLELIHGSRKMPAEPIIRISIVPDIEIASAVKTIQFQLIQLPQIRES